MNDSPVFIMSSERSGSNLLRVLLGSHSALAAPRPLQLLMSFKTLIPGYGDLTVRNNAQHLFDDCVALANHPYNAWNLNLDFEYLYEHYTLHGLIDFFHLLYSEYAIRQNKRRFVCKENNLFDFAGQLADYYNDPKFIYLYRDPRDYTASWRGLPVGPKTHFLAAGRWLDEQRRCECFMATTGLDVHCLKYEALITATEQQMTDLLTFLGVSVEETCFSIPEGNNKDVAWNMYWKNLTKPILKQNFNKYREVLNETTINMIETVTKDYMSKLHYACDTEANWKRPKLFALRERVASKMIDCRRRFIPTETSRRLASKKVLLQTIARGFKAQR
jgi:hypothetical protein